MEEEKLTAMIKGLLWQFNFYVDRRKSCNSFCNSFLNCWKTTEPLTFRLSDCFY